LEFLSAKACLRFGLQRTHDALTNSRHVRATTDDVGALDYEIDEKKKDPAGQRRNAWRAAFASRVKMLFVGVRIF
jgi:hypothetical protein